MKIEMSCISAQPTAGPDGATPGGARVVLVERVSSGTNKGARLEMFLNAEHMNDVKVGDVRVVTIV